MRRIKILLTLIISLSLFTACSNNETEKSMSNQLSDNAKASQETDSESLNQSTDDSNDFLSPEYDYDANKLNLTDLSTGTVIASHSFENAQTVLLTDRTSQGYIVMLSSPTAADVKKTDGITIISGNDSAETLSYWLFDEKLNLIEQYELSDETLVNGIMGQVFSVAPDGKTLIYAEGSSLYQYTFATQKQEKISVSMNEEVYYEAIGYSDSGNYLAFYGSITGQEKDTAYGSVDLKNDTVAVFTASDFSGSALTVNGEYAAVSDTVLPDSMGGPAKTGSILFIDLGQQQGKEIRVESGEESGLAAVSKDGQYIVTCAGGDSPSGFVRSYKVSDGTKVAEQNYTMDTNCKPYEILVIGHSAYAALGTDNGNTLSQAVDIS